VSASVFPEIIQDPERRHDFVLFFDVSDGNPNGDPDAGNLPRVDPETMHGIVTDVSLKRRVRDYVSVAAEQPMFIQSDVSLNSLISGAFREVGLEPPEVTITDEALIEWFEQHLTALEGHVQLEIEPEHAKVLWVGESTRRTDIQQALRDVATDAAADLRRKIDGVARDLATRATAASKAHRAKAPEARQRLCQGYYDIRMFGAVLQTGLNAGQVRGPAQFTFARSVDPIATLDLAITRKARTTERRMETGPTEIGRKPMIPYGLYRAHGFFSPHFARQTGVSGDDLRLLWEALGNMFEFDRSASRGQMACRGVYIFSHESALGNAPAHRLQDLVTATLRNGAGIPRRFADYEMTVADGEVPVGVTLTVLYG
jgi:CRISPR-associated protein Csd2